MQLFKLSEGTAARRRVYVHCVDATDGITPETGEASGQPQVSKNGGAFANTSATLTAIGNGAYYVELTAGELDTLGFVTIRYKSANTAEFQTVAQVVAFDPYDATALGLSRLDAAISSVAAAVWAVATSGLTSAGTIGKLLVDNINATVSSRSTLTAANVWDHLTSAISMAGSIGKLLKDDIDATISSRASQTSVDTIDDYVDTEVAAILAAVDTEVAAIKAKTDNLPASPAAVGDIPTANAIADQVWDEATSGHTTAGSTGAALTAAGAAGDPWSTALPGSYAAGTAGYLLSQLVGAGSGAIEHTHTIAGLDNVHCWVTTANDSQAAVVAAGYTDAAGEVTFFLDAGTYYIWQERAGYSFTNPVQITVA